MQILMSKTQSESDTLHRQLVKNLNTQAGLHIIKQQVAISFFIQNYFLKFNKTYL
jgi:hypothetical protein